MSERRVVPRLHTFPAVNSPNISPNYFAKTVPCKSAALCVVDTGGRGLAATVETATQSPAVIQPTDDSDWRDGSARQQVADAVASVS